MPKPIITLTYHLHVSERCHSNYYSVSHFFFFFGWITELYSDCTIAEDFIFFFFLLFFSFFFFFSFLGRSLVIIGHYTHYSMGNGPPIQWHRFSDIRRFQRTFLWRIFDGQNVVGWVLLARTKFIHYSRQQLLHIPLTVLFISIPNRICICSVFRLLFIYYYYYFFLYNSSLCDWLSDGDSQTWRAMVHSLTLHTLSLVSAAVAAAASSDIHIHGSKYA